MEWVWSHSVAAAWHMLFPSVCPAQERVNRSDLKQSCKVFEIHFHLLSCTCLFPLHGSPSRQGICHLSMFIGQFWKLLIPKCYLQQTSSYSVSNCGRYVSEYWVVSKKMTEDQGVRAKKRILKSSEMKLGPSADPERTLRQIVQNCTQGLNVTER